MWKAFAKRKFPIYYDDDQSMVKILLEQEVEDLQTGEMPALLIVDKNGMIRYAHYGDGLSDIPKNEEDSTIYSEYAVKWERRTHIKIDFIGI